MQGRISQDEAVCPSFKSGNCDKTTEIKTKILTPQQRTIIPVFPQEKWFVEDDPLLYLKFWAKLTRSSKNANFQSILARSTSAVTPSKKVQLSVIRSPLPAFQRAQDEHRTLSLSYPPPQKKITIICDNFETVRHRMSVSQFVNH